MKIKRVFFDIRSIGSLPEVIFLVSLVSQIWSYVLLPFIFLLLIFVNVPVGIALENPLLRKQSKSVKQKIKSIKLVNHNLAQIINTYTPYAVISSIFTDANFHIFCWESHQWNEMLINGKVMTILMSKEPLFTYLYIIETVFFYMHEKWCFPVLCRKYDHFSSIIMIRWQLAPVIYSKADEYSFVSPSWSGSKLKSPNKIISFSPGKNSRKT